MQNIGNVFLHQKNLDTALKYYQKSLKLNKELGDKQQISDLANSISTIYSSQKKYGKSLEFSKKSLTIAKEIGSLSEERNAYLQLSSIYEKLGQYKKALEFFKKFKTINDSIFSSEKSKQIIEMETLYQTEKKEKENQILTQKNEFNELTISRHKSLRNFLIIILLIIFISMVLIYNQYRLKKFALQELKKSDKIIRKQKNELEIMNKTRNRFFSIISHDLKNSFTSLQMGTELLSDIEELDKKEISMIANEIKISVENLYRFLENLLEWARIQIGRIHHNPQQFDISRMISEVLEISKAKAKIKDIELSSIIGRCTVFADKNMVYSVLQNLISNAIKFTNSGGEIAISNTIADNNVQITVSDNGIGLNNDQLEKLFKVDEIQSRPGTNNEKGTGFGLVLCKEFIEKNNGRIWIESKFEKGTSVHFSLPKGS